MPRPGPRPYECVRRAWHSDRHLPIRGSLIQEIFRFVGEVHSTATKKNKEWQEKLPIVVLKAEEIMYSKANSVSEYVDLKTLRDRVNDAVNTIIRNDESAENGKLLQPCIEAALHLGCTARRSSRSQQNNNPRYYLTSGNREDPSSLSGNVDNKKNSNQTTNSPVLLQHSRFMVDAKTSSFPSCVASSRPIAQQTDCSRDRFFCSKKCYCPGDNHQGVTPSNTSYTVYPLYFGELIQPENSNFNFRRPVTFDSHFVESGNMCSNRNILPTKSCIENVDPVAFLECASEKPHEVGCDLSLRLGPLVLPIPYAQGLENAGVVSSKEGTNFSTPSPSQKITNFFSFPNADPNDQLDSTSTKWIKEGDNNVEAMIRKRKAISIYTSKNRQLVGS